MFAVIRTGGKQYKVAPKEYLRVPTIDAEAGKTVNIDDVLMVSDGKSTKVGSPAVSGAKVTAKVIEHIRDDKIVVFKKKRRQNYRRTKGHRQGLTVIEITDIKTA